MPPHPSAHTTSPSQQPLCVKPKGDPCFSGSAVPSTLLVTIWLLHPAPWDLLGRAEDPDLPLGMQLAGRLRGISGHQRVPAQATSQLGKPALTSARKGLQLHRLLRGDLQSSPGSGGKEDTGHRRVCPASAVTPAPARCQLCSLLSWLLHDLSPSGAPLLSLCLPLFPPSALAADPLISGWVVFFFPSP